MGIKRPPVILFILRSPILHGKIKKMDLHESHKQARAYINWLIHYRFISMVLYWLHVKFWVFAFEFILPANTKLVCTSFFYVSGYQDMALSLPHWIGFSHWFQRWLPPPPLPPFFLQSWWTTLTHVFQYTFLRLELSCQTLIFNIYLFICYYLISWIICLFIFCDSQIKVRHLVSEPRRPGF